MFWTIVGAILFVIFLPLIIGVVVVLILYVLILISVLLLWIGSGGVMLVSFGLVALGGVWTVSMAVD